MVPRSSAIDLTQILTGGQTAFAKVAQRAGTMPNVASARTRTLAAELPTQKQCRACAAIVRRLRNAGIRQ